MSDTFHSYQRVPALAAMVSNFYNQHFQANPISRFDSLLNVMSVMDLLVLMNGPLQGQTWCKIANYVVIKVLEQVHLWSCC